MSALTFDTSGNLYATLEKPHGEGSVVRLRLGIITTVLDNLNKPDGILMQGGSMLVTNEARDRSLLVYDHGTERQLEGVYYAEGIDTADDHHVLVIEDRKTDGRLLKIDRFSGNIEVLLSGLIEGEGVCQSPSGDIYFVEKTSVYLQKYSNGHAVNVTDGLNKPGFLNCLPDGSILITEDRTNFGRLLHYKLGVMHVLATRLRSPQSVIVGPEADYYIAEQRRNRILVIEAI